MVLTPIAIHAAAVLTEAEAGVLAETTDFRFSLKTAASCAEAVEKIDAYAARIAENTANAAVSDEIKLVLENILVWEKYNYLYESDIKHPDLEPLIKTQYEKVKAWFKTHSGEPHSTWLYYTAGDILSCCMQFLPLTTAMSEGLTVKKYYDTALEQDPYMVFTLINIAQWYFYAPAISGGGKKKAHTALETARAVAKTVPEQFYATLLLSQVLFEEGEKRESAELLADADELYPGTYEARSFSALNGAGYSYFYYTLNREKVDKKLGAALKR